MPRLLGGIALAACLLVVADAHAQPSTSPPASPTAGAAAATGNAPAKPSDAPLPSCLDQTIRGQLSEQLKPRGVQKRNFRKDNKLVLLAHGGVFGGDLTSSSWIAGGSLGYFFTEDLGISLGFDLTPLKLDLDEPLNEFFGDNRFEPGMAYVALANVLWSPMHAKLKLGGGIVHADVMLFAGGGRMFHDAVQGLSFNAGMALDMFVTRALTVRLDIRDLMAVEEVAGETRFTNNIVATIGLALWIPTGL
ncbi:MAG: outer membrane beta-barrel domain-containing protein [Myxococcales bacterium]|nr:outer membrane beta-barrel domain-containing protein [Myxococcales bacterium]